MAKKAPQYYRLELESYNCPRWLSASSLYYGTLEELKKFTEQLSMDISTAIRYREVIAAVDRIDADNPTEMDLCVTPVQYVTENEYILNNHQWTHRFLSGAVLACAADRIEYSQMLLKSPQGLDRVIKARFIGLRFCLPLVGWVFPEDRIRGFPGIITWDGTAHNMSLYAGEWVYIPEDSHIAYWDMENVTVIDLDACLHDLVGEG